MLEKREADVIIIGGGIMGCATAYRLAKQGVDVLVLEKKEIGNGGSCRNAGGVRQSARDPKELPLAMYAVANIWPHLSEELGVDVEYHQGGNLRLGLTENRFSTTSRTTRSTRPLLTASTSGWILWSMMSSSLRTTRTRSNPDGHYMYAGK